MNWKRIARVGVYLLLLLSIPGVHAEAIPAREVLVGRQLYQPFFRDEGEEDRWIGPLLVDKTPVTNRQFLKFVSENPKWRRSKVVPIFASQGYLGQWSGDQKISTEFLDWPVVHVSWFAARAYCEFYNKRLLTIAEWEMVADGQAPEVRDLILRWYSQPGTRLKSVGSGETNKWGLQDIHGLVWEWVEDFASVIISNDSRASNTKGEGLFCGGSAVNSKDPTQYATFMRYAFRSSLHGNYVGSSLGFRCGRDVTDEE